MNCQIEQLVKLIYEPPGERPKEKKKYKARDVIYFNSIQFKM